MIPINLRPYIACSGPRDAKVAAVGEAPGAKEEEFGYGFAGRSGEEFNRMLNDAGLLRTETFVTNVFKVRPTDNEISEFVVVRKKPPDPSWILWQGRWVHPLVYKYIGELKQELTILKPNVVIALGGTPLWALCNVDGIQKWRGSLLESTLVPGLKVIPTYHPAALLRMWQWRWDAVQDLRRVKENINSPKIELPDWTFHIRPSFDEVMQILDTIEQEAKNGAWLSVDIETSKGKTCRVVSCIGIAWTLNRAICIPLERKDGSSYWSEVEEAVILQRLFGILTKPWCKVVGQNLLYDCYYFAVFYNAYIRPWIDTLLGFHFLFPGKSKKLHEQASLLCKFYRYWKDEGKMIDKHQSEEQIWIYNCQDTIYTLEVAMRQEELIAKRPAHLWEFMKKRWDSAFELSLRGIRIDANSRKEISKQLGQVMATELADLKTIFGPDFKPRSSPQLKEIVYDLFKVEPVLDRKTHRPTVNDGALTVLGEREPLLKPAFTRIARYKTAGVLKSTFVDAEGSGDRLYTAFNPMGPETFRWSSRKTAFGKGLNLQNVPRDDSDADLTKRFPSIRSLFIADPGYFLFEVDQKSADLQVVIWEAGDEELKRAIRQGKDIYTDSAIEAGIVGMARQDSKMFIHLTDYGGTPKVAAIACKMRIADAELRQQLWFARHPGIKHWHKRVKDCLEKTRSVSNAFGLRIVYFDRVEDVLKEALAWIPQTTVANITDYAIINIREQLPSVQCLINGHDSILGQAPLSERATIGPKIRKALKVVVPYNDPLVISWSLKIGNPSWGKGEIGCWNTMQVAEPNNIIKSQKACSCCS